MPRSSGPQSERIPVTLLTGFLGSGKTTVLNHLVRQPELADALVIINEFGEMALDHLLVAHSSEHRLVEMSSGCVCCTIRGDLAKTLREISWRFSRNGQRQFRRVLIETTGLADPTPIMQMLMTHPQLTLQYRLDGVVATVDLATGAQALDQHPEALRQAALADVLLLTKSDLVSEVQHDSLTSRLAHLNPAAQRWMIHHGEIAPAAVLNLCLVARGAKLADVRRWLNAESYGTPPGPPRYQQRGGKHILSRGLNGQTRDHHALTRHDDHIRAFCFSIEEPIAAQTLNAWLAVLGGLLGRNILRVKGILNIEGQAQPMVVHGVKHILHPYVSLPAWPTEDRRSRLVFITQDIGREVIEQAFDAFRPRP